MAGRRSATQAKDKTRKTALATVAAVGATAMALAIWGIWAICQRLAATYNRQCRVTNIGEQVEISTGKQINARMIRVHFGLTNGADLASIDFARLRERLLADTPNLKDLKISLRQPNHLRIEAIERIPIVRVMGYGPKASKNYAADREGYIFWYPQRETALLPIIRDAKMKSGGQKRISGMALAALNLLEEASSPEYDVLKIQEVDTLKRDYLLVTLGDSSRAKIAWEDMGRPSRESHASLTNQLSRLTQVVKSNVAAGTRLWNATDWGTPGRIYADDPTKAE